MSMTPEIRDQAYQFFIEEAPELLQIIETGLLSLRQERTTGKVHEIMRAAHSLKGGAASVELDAIKAIAHRLEDSFKALYSEEVTIDAELESLLLQAYDCLRLPLTEQIDTGTYNPEAAQTTAESIFAQIEAQLGDALAQADNYMPTSADLGIDIVTSIFEIDVAQGLAHLQEVMAHPEKYEVVGEVRAQAEVFSGFSEMLNLPGFGEIAHTVVTALERHPDRALQVAQLMIADCTAGRDAVLAGDRAQGGRPSEALIALAQTGEAAQRVAEPAPVFDWDESLLAEAATVSEAASTDGVEAGPSNSDPLLDDVFESPGPEREELDDVFGEAAPTDSDPLLDDIFGEAAPLDADPLFDEFSSSLNGEAPAAESPALSGEQNSDEQSLDAAVQSIEQSFAQLPALSELPGEQTGSRKPDRQTFPGSPASSAPAKAAAPARLTIRVDLNRLEQMNNQVGELAINRNRLSLQNEQLQGTVRKLLTRFTRFRETADNLRTLSDQMLVAPERFGKTNGSASQPVSLSLGDSFDSLELDSYGAMYSLLQGLLEEIIQLEETVDDITLFAKQSNQSIEEQRQMLANLRDELMWARMLPLSEVLNRFPRVLRDLSHTYSKSVDLKLNGTEVLVDKAALEKLYDPLLHLLRNAFDHGIESPERRQQQGKSETGIIEIRAYHQSNQTIIEVKDDGQGLNLEKIGRRAVERGLLSPEERAIASSSQLLDLIFEPGFSTADQVSEISGRGVGLDVVRSQLRALKGTINVTSAPGQGTTFTLRLPLTLTVSKLLVCLFGSTPFAIPSDSIEDLLIPQPEQLKFSGSQRFLHWQGEIIPIYPMAELLEYRCPLPETTLSKAFETVASPQEWAAPLLLLRRGQQVSGLEVSRLVVEQELVIKSFGPAMSSPSYTYGCTILGDGTLIPVIDGAALLDTVLRSDASTTIAASSQAQRAQSAATASRHRANTVLVVDDSAALRRTLALTLQKAGYRVLQAKDGREALDRLQQSAVQLVICDVEMPNMNGFEFLSQRRQDPGLAKIPVAMLTSRSNNKHRQLATHLGATAYFTKPYIEPELLKAVAELIAHHSAELAVSS
ncbi:MAG: response regulator [Cyanophyceae cyanobacterium]